MIEHCYKQFVMFPNQSSQFFHERYLEDVEKLQIGKNRFNIDSKFEKAQTLIEKHKQM